jgi:aminoglycoside phosphotransferase (APT) family kinase protein
VPELLLHDPEPPPILVMKYTPGISVEAARTVSPWIEAGWILRALHDLPAPAGLPKFDWFGRAWNDFLVTWSRHVVRGLRGKIALPHGLLTSLERQLVSGFETLPEPSRVFLHGDCAFVHFILSPGGRRIRSLIDFGDAGTGDPMWDIATMVLWDPVMMNPVLKGYDAGMKLTVRAITSIRPT